MSSPIVIILFSYYEQSELNLLLKQLKSLKNPITYSHHVLYKKIGDAWIQKFSKENRITLYTRN